MHVHTAPDVRPRKLDDRELLSRAQEARMAGVVLKNHHASTADRAHLLRAKADGVAVFGGIVLNESVGGLDPSAVRSALGSGAKVVWMPTISAAHHAERNGGAHGSGGIRVAKNGHVVPEIAEILAEIAGSGAVLATGHISPDESATLVAEALRAGVARVVITHPASHLVGMAVDRQIELARMGVFIEIAEVTTRQAVPVSRNELAAHARAIGPASVVLTSDLGQPENPYPADGLAELIEGMLAAGISQEEVRLMVQHNPARLLGIES